MPNRSLLTVKLLFNSLFFSVLNERFTLGNVHSAYIDQMGRMTRSGHHGAI